jgi:hypothetical protein
MVDNLCGEQTHTMEHEACQMAREAFNWQMNMHLTQASLLLAERNIEESAASDSKAYTLAKTIPSHKGKVEVEQ